MYEIPSAMGDKVDGHFYFIQDEPYVFDSNGERMSCIGQIIGSEFTELGDCGCGYIFWSQKTGKTAIEFQDY